MFSRNGLERIAANTFTMNIYSTQNTTDVSEERDLRNAAFMYFQVLIYILLDITSNRNSSAKKDLLDHFKHIYEGSTAEERIIQELENNYRDEEAIRWFTRPTFLYNTLNKALRDFDFEVLFALRFLINDLQRQLAIAHETYLTSYALENPIITVYRGQNISVADLNYLHQNIGQFVAMQSFLSTSFDRAVASFFAQAAAPTTDEITCIVFEFHLDTRITKTKPYANIKHLSYFRDEEELLLMLGTIFRIEQLEYNELEKTWIAILSLCSEDDYELKELVKHLKNETGEGITSLGNLLQRQGDYEKARLYFQQLLLDPSLDDLDRARCYRGLAMVAQALHTYDEATENFEKQLELLNTCDDNQEEIGTAYTFLGEVYLFKNDLDQALTYEQKAFDILVPLNAAQLTNVYAIMANIYMQKKDFPQAIVYHEKGLELDYERLPGNHENFGITYANIGATYHLSGDYIKALEYYSKAREIYSKILTPKHQHVLTVEENIRRVKKLINK
ncbi:unnamed protein product [Adineta steineri]|uniref:NAD(P)(+)--arginine ADP-ribosyltransferase n=1 Tax=Adineta steineri TaxID=433720 RepID=A0A814BD88_9BILA|nr:unnamed protein product [Adineta steineri]CAF4066076.1 unnamed protein product [Adineta steineri]